MVSPMATPFLNYYYLRLRMAYDDLSCTDDLTTSIHYLYFINAGRYYRAEANIHRSVWCTGCCSFLEDPRSLRIINIDRYRFAWCVVESNSEVAGIWIWI